MRTIDSVTGHDEPSGVASHRHGDVMAIRRTAMDQGAIYTDGTYLAKNPTWHEEDSPYKAWQVAELLRDNHIAPASICEIGCGAGGILSCLASGYGEGVELVGYEVSPQAFEICREKEGPNLHFFLTDFFAEEGRTFDVLLAIDVFEHIEDYFGFLRKLKDRAEYKIFHIPLDLSVMTLLRGTPLLETRSSVGHIHYFTKETALATLADTGYEVLDHRYTARYLNPYERRSHPDPLRLVRRLSFSVAPDAAVRVLGRASLSVLAR